MPAPSAQTLQRIAAETQLPAATLEKVLRLLDVLQAIAEDRDLKTRVALKGGTALNVFHLRLDRLSVDIDLNDVGSLERAEMEADRPLVDDALLRLLEAQGYQVRRQPPGHAGGKWVARYTSALGGGATLEVDLNYMARGPLFGVQSMSSIPLGGVTATGIPVIDLHEVVAGKLVALLDRQAARDLFDARRILETQTLDWSLVRAGVMAWGAAGRRDWREASLDIGGDPRELRAKLAICLPRNFFAAAGGVDAWIADTVAVCRAGLASLFERSAGEAAFLDRLLDAGEIDPSGLAVADDVKARIANMPMLVWKAQNVRQHIQTHGRSSPAPP